MLLQRLGLIDIASRVGEQSLNQLIRGGRRRGLRWRLEGVALHFCSLKPAFGAAIVVVRNGGVYR